MSPPKPLPSLEHICVTNIIDNFERFMIPYNENWEEIFIDERPTFGPFMELQSSILTRIIEEFIKREELKIKYLRILLPEDAESLTCDENTKFSPFGCDAIELISKRCPYFKILHCHYGLIRKISFVLAINSRLTDSIPSLKHLQEINFCDTCILKKTIECIALNCPNLRSLNLHRTHLSEHDLDPLVSEESVLKNSLSKLIIDETYVPNQSVLQCLLKLPNLTHFQSDSTINAALQLYETATSDGVPKFKTTVCKNKFLRIDQNLLNEYFLNFLVEKFPEVDHLNISFQKDYNSFVSHLLTSLNHITHLELSSWGEDNSIAFLLPAVSSCKNLITLKLENFLHVDLSPLENALKNLENLTLVNNTYIRGGEVKFESLKEFRVILFQENFISPSRQLYFEHTQMPYEILLSILSSENIEKVLLYGQSNFISTLVEELLERGCLKKLKELKVFKCLLGIDAIWDLVTNDNSLTDIVLDFCHNISEEDVYQISTYCVENNLAVSIKQVLENPYYLRWFVQESEVPS